MKTFFHSLLIITAFLLISCSVFAQIEFWGMSREGGTFGFGCIFKTDNRGENPVSVYSFSDTLNGIHPEGSLIQSDNRKLYGMTKYGGTYNMGTMFEFDIFTNTFTKIIDFDSTNYGCYPSGSLVNLYYNYRLFGMNGHGGLNNLGVIFEYNIYSNTFSKLLDFDSTNTGGNSENGSLFINPTFPNFNLIGTNPIGGANNQGVIFKYEYGYDSITQRADLPAMAGSGLTRGDLLEISPGVFLGMNATGGNSLGGYIFEYNLLSNIITVKSSFNSSTGINPFGKLTQAGNGKYYGLTSAGGVASTGTLFEYDYLIDSITNVLDFGALLTNISAPHGSLLLGSNGNLYGMGTYGSVCGAVLFEYDYNTNLLVEKSNLCSTIGAIAPYYTSLIEIDADSTHSVWPGDCNYDLLVNNVDFLYLGVAYNDTGPVRNAATINYEGQYCDPWAYSYFGELYTGLVNAKHADCNGNGIVDTLDTDAIYLNYDQTHLLRLRPPQDNYNSHDYLCLYADRTSIAPGDPVNFGIYMSGITPPVDYIYGIAFSLQFDPALVDTNRISLDFSPSIFGNIGVDLISFEKDNYSSGLIHAAITRIDHADLANAGGLVGNLQVYSLSSISTLSDMLIRPTAINCSRADGYKFNLYECPDTVTIDPTLAGLKNISSEDNFSLFPNPTTGQLTLNINNELIQLVELYNVSGEKVLTLMPNKNEVGFSVAEFSTGIYYIRVVTRENVYNSRIQISH